MIFCYNRRMKRRGFTLIELLVVIAIIGLLATLSVISFSTSSAKARDVKRKNDLKSIQKALELYYNDHNAYPSSGGAWRSVTSGYGSYPTTGTGAYIPNLSPTYMPALPTDPKPMPHPELLAACSLSQSGYLYRSDGIDYKLLAHCALETGPVSASDIFYDPARPTWAIMVCNMGSSACATW